MTKTTRALGFACLVWLWTFGALAVGGSEEEPAAARLERLFAEEWAFRLREFPRLAASMGAPDAGAGLVSMTLDDLARRAEERRRFLARLRQIDRQQLDRDGRIDYDVFERQLHEAIESFELQDHLLPLTVDTGFHIDLAHLPSESLLATVEDYERYLGRLAAVPAYFDQHITLMQAGLERGMTLPRVVLEGYEVTIQSHVVERPEESLFFGPFENLPTTLPAVDRSRLLELARERVRSVVDSYRRFLDFMVREYIPGARTTLGASEMPGGKAYYASRVRHFTTLDLSPDEIHQIGLREVARIRGEMEEVIAEVGFAGDFAAFLEHLRTDPRFYAKTPDELLREAAFIAKRMDGKLPSLFSTLPRLPYGIEPVPDHLAPKYTGGRYVPAPRGSHRAGTYWVNTYALASRPLYVLTALTLHEAVPGHHLQIARSEEIEDLPPFRRFSYISAFGEGWGLYSEWLGLEAGLYDDPYSNFGRLTYEMWRACRLVVDTGLHAMGWSRDRAMDYLASNTALSLHEVRTETDRYISWPGQALAYKLGELKIRELRRRTEKALGAGFDIRDFHDRILENGSIPLSVLDEVISAYIDEKVESKSGA